MKKYDLEKQIMYDRSFIMWLIVLYWQIHKGEELTVAVCFADAFTTTAFFNISAVALAAMMKLKTTNNTGSVFIGKSPHPRGLVWGWSLYPYAHAIAYSAIVHMHIYIRARRVTAEIGNRPLSTFVYNRNQQVLKTNSKTNTQNTKKTILQSVGGIHLSIQF